MYMQRGVAEASAQADARDFPVREKSFLSRVSSFQLCKERRLAPPPPPDCFRHARNKSITPAAPNTMLTTPLSVKNAIVSEGSGLSSVPTCNAWVTWARVMR